MNDAQLKLEIMVGIFMYLIYILLDLNVDIVMASPPCTPSQIFEEALPETGGCSAMRSIYCFNPNRFCYSRFEGGFMHNR